MAAHILINMLRVLDKSSYWIRFVSGNLRRKPYTVPSRFINFWRQFYSLAALIATNFGHRDLQRHTESKGHKMRILTWGPWEFWAGCQQVANLHRQQACLSSNILALFSFSVWVKALSADVKKVNSWNNRDRFCLHGLYNYTWERYTCNATSRGIL